jgi:hypothetical protein
MRLIKLVNLLQQKQRGEETAMSNSEPTEGRLKKEVTVPGSRHTGGENHNRLHLLIPNLSCEYIFGFSIFP